MHQIFWHFRVFWKISTTEYTLKVQDRFVSKTFKIILRDAVDAALVGQFSDGIRCIENTLTKNFQRSRVVVQSLVVDVKQG